jgi:hypothetical protein
MGIFSEVMYNGFNVGNFLISPLHVIVPLLYDYNTSVDISENNMFKDGWSLLCVR